VDAEPLNLRYIYPEIPLTDLGKQKCLKVFFQ